VGGIHDVNSNEQLQVYATGAVCRSWTEEVERKKDFSTETFSGEELLICYVLIVLFSKSFRPEFIDLVAV
jgi:hypothetical protein